MALAPASFLTKRDKVVFNLEKDSGMLLDLTTGKCFEVNALGCEVWQLIDGSRDLSAISQAIAAKYKISQEQALADLSEWAQAMIGKGLLILSR